MAENYKLLYEQMKKIVTEYQDKVVPCLREIIKHLEQNQIKVRCKDCKHGIPTSDGGYRCDHVDEYYAWGYRTKADDFCSYGERRTEDDHHRTE